MREAGLRSETCAATGGSAPRLSGAPFSLKH
jgi:hypothetical protein